MKRRDVIRALAFLPFIPKAMNLQNLKNISDTFSNTERIPAFFIGHGNPMNAVLDNPFTKSLRVMGESVKQKPNAILVVSAHWLTRGTFVSTTPKPETIYDFGGFPAELYKVTYPSPGSPEYAREVMKTIPEVKENPEWGLDHGAWTVLKHMFPAADIPVFELSIDYHQPMQYHFDLAQKLKVLRRKGVLIMGSGNIVHNLRLWFSKKDETPFDWTVEFDEWVKGRINARDFKSLIEYEKHGASAMLSVPTPDHYIPMLYSLALTEKDEDIQFTYEEVFSAASMRAFRIG
ncbi:MAG TPA: 4,5-DOPA dioxygenase extradiol [Bacteroidia bacterium]|nr:4,5-DOPA dioxygenase extradiol [Bacteroidia bacterium]